MTENFLRVPTIDGQNSCHAAYRSESIRCAYYEACQRQAAEETKCSSGAEHIWIKPEQMNDYLALKLVS